MQHALSHCLTCWQDHFYVCLGHLKDRSFCAPVADEAEIAAKKRKVEIDREIEIIKQEYEEKLKKKKKDKGQKEKEKSEKSGKDEESKDEDDKNIEKEKDAKVIQFDVNVGAMAANCCGRSKL